MPLVYKGRMMSLNLASEKQLSQMTTPDLIEYEAYLWRWMRYSPPNVVTVLNAIYREMEWRAQDSEFR